MNAATPSQDAIAVEVAKDVQDLANSSAQKSDAAELRLLAGGADEFPAIEAAATHPNLPPDVATKLKKILNVMRPLQPARLKVATARAVVADWQEKSFLAAYQAAGKKDPKWDAAVTAALSLYAHDTGESEATRSAVNRAVQLGCNDPLMLDIAGDCTKWAPTPDLTAANKYFKQASVAIQSSSYPPHIKFAVDVDYGSQLAMRGEPLVNEPGMPPLPEDMGPNPMASNDRTMGTAASLFHKAVAIWPRVLKEAGIPSKVLENMANQYIDASSFPQGVDQKIFDEIVSPLSAALPNDMATLNVEARFYYKWAWQARGGAAARDVPKEQFQLFFERLQKAEPLLTKSAKLFPDDPEASNLMIALLLDVHGQASRAAIDDWFKHAIAIDPDNIGAYRELLRTVLPQWGGSSEQLSGFMKRCVLSMNYHARVPFIATEVFDQLANLDENIWRDPKTWETINKLYSPWLEANPDDNVTRSRYTYLACQCRQWKEAKSQFAVLGDKAVEGQFGGLNGAMRMWKQQAAVH